jgi:hypothetical protein
MRAILQDLRELKRGPAELRKFGLLVGGVFAVIGLWLWLRHRPSWWWFFTPGMLLVAFGMVAPRALKPVYLAWMTLAILLGFVVSNVLLVIFFFLVMTPIGLLARVAGKDFMRRKLDAKAESYWIGRPAKAKSKSDYERQF